MTLDEKEKKNNVDMQKSGGCRPNCASMLY